jgi:hypothetical protein
MSGVAFPEGEGAFSLRSLYCVSSFAAAQSRAATNTKEDCYGQTHHRRAASDNRA